MFFFPPKLSKRNLVDFRTLHDFSYINQAIIKLLTLNVNINLNYSLRMTFLTEQEKNSKTTF